MKKAILICLMAVSVISLCACGQKKAAEETTAAAAGMANPNLYGVTEETLLEYTGLSFNMPQGAENVSYNVIAYESESPIAEMNFTLDGNSAYIRAKSTGLLPDDLPDITASAQDLIAAAKEKPEFDISGLYYDWTGAKVTTVDYNDAFLYLYDKENTGFIAWLDVVPGILYNLGMTEGADADKLESLATAAYLPMQGEVG
ncbi:MAG: hypothetical protein Q4E57_01405 [Eubacteriales bacterium]|nr:hypothetical protein [Eubacteriales bacterium]